MTKLQHLFWSFSAKNVKKKTVTIETNKSPVERWILKRILSGKIFFLKKFNQLCFENWINKGTFIFYRYFDADGSLYDKNNFLASWKR